MNGVYISKKILIAFGVIVAALLFILLQIIENSGTSISRPTIVTDASRFFTVSGCVNKYITYLQSKSTEELLTILTPQYVEDNSITEQNIYTFLDQLPTINNYTFSAREMYEIDLGDDIYRYEIYGWITEDSFNSMNTNKRDTYYSVTLNEQTLTFSINPSTSEIFEEVKNEQAKN